MIRLNDNENARINEKDINYYYPRDDSNAICMEICGTYTNFSYDTKEERDKDIEMLDKLFDVKSIEDKANAYPHEIDTFNYAMSGIEKECEPAKEEYITWDYVKGNAKLIEAKLPNGDIKLLYYVDSDIVIESDMYREGRIYDEDLFNALKLKKVE